jgi:hypothetical protein
MSRNIIYKGSCHCGQVGFEITDKPEKLVDCNCSICRRLSPLWGHIDSKAFTKTGKGETIAYMHGDRTLSIHTCRNCGCTTHWENEQPEPGYMAVNFRMCDPVVINEFRIRRFDGADTWEFID